LHFSFQQPCRRSAVRPGIVICCALFVAVPAFPGVGAGTLFGADDGTLFRVGCEAGRGRVTPWIEAIRYLIAGAERYQRQLEAERAARGEKTVRQSGMSPVGLVLGGIAAACLVFGVGWLWWRRRGRWVAGIEVRSLLDSMPVMIAIRDPNGRFVFANRAMAALFDVSPRDLIGRAVDEYLSESEDIESILENDRRAFSENGPLFVPEERIVKPDGSTVWLQTTRIPLNPTGEVLCVSTDVTAQKQRLDAIRESEEILAATLNSIGDGVIVVDIEGKIDWMNAPAERLTGWNRDEARGRDLTEVYVVLDGETRQPCENPVISILRSGDIVDFGADIILKTREDTERKITASGAPIRDGDGKIIGTVLVFRDMTEQLTRIERRGFTRKMEAIGQVAGGIAHDFNNILAGIMGYAELIRNKVGNDPECVAYAEAISEAAMQAANLNGQLLAFARRGRFQTVPVDVHEVIQEVLDSLRPDIDPRIGVHTSFRAEPSTLLGDPRQLRDAFRNLIVNACEAMPIGGALSITTDVREIDEEWIKSHPSEACEIKPGRYLVVSVADTGVGIDKPILQRIFEPFFSTKKVGQGRGMGLAAVWGIVKNHEGAITVESEPGQGSIFSIYLPVTPLPVKPKVEPPASEKRALGMEAPEQPAPEKPAPEPVGKSTGRSRKARILLVDDDVRVRTVAEQFLEQLGYDVEVREDGVTAVEYYRSHWREIDLVILDMVMRKMGGREAFSKMRAINPSAKILLCTGYTMGDDVQKLLDMGAVGVLQKPFSSTELRINVEKALSGDAQDSRRLLGRR